MVTKIFKKNTCFKSLKNFKAVKVFRAEDRAHLDLTIEKGLRVVFLRDAIGHFSKSSWTKTEFFFGFSMKFCLEISYFVCWVHYLNQVEFKIRITL